MALGIDFETRLTRMERQNRRLRVLCGALLVAVLGSITPTVTAQIPPPARLTGQNFVIVTPTSQVRGSFGVEANDPALVLRDEHGRERLRLTITDSGPSFTWTDKTGKKYEVLSAPGVKRVLER